jgi:ferritin-like protein
MARRVDLVRRASIRWEHHMAGASNSLHESADILGEDGVDLHRALVSIQEELEAVDWYNQRSIATQDADLAAILEHHRDEEKEHAAMLLEWVRRHDAAFDRHLRTYLFTEASITELEHADDD